MEKRDILTAEEMLEKIFFYMNCLVAEKNFSSAIVTLTELGRTLVNAERTSFWYRDTENKSYWTLAASDTDRIVVPEGAGVVGSSIENNEVILLNSPYEDSRFNPQVDKDTGYVTKSILCMPVTNSEGVVIGAYQAINKLDVNGISNFNEQDVKRLALAAGYSGKTLETYLLRQQSQKDPLTKLKNRRGFYDYYDTYITPVLKSDTAGIIMCDIDFFKKVNDVYGHNAGDAVLVYVAELMKNVVGDLGDVFRWGGEEFIILMPKTGIEDAVSIAENIRQKIMESVCTYEESEIKVTMSFGVCELDSNRNTDGNVKAADEKLYGAKATGRNKVLR